jgi:Bacterial Ig-like domain (group 2)
MARLIRRCIPVAIALGIALCTGCSSSSSHSSFQPTLVSISVTPATASIGVQGTQQFKAVGTFSDNSTQDLTTSVQWSSSAPNVATINSAGLASGVAAGTTTILATSAAVGGSSSLAVTALTLVSITVGPSDPSIPVGETQQFTATGTFSDNSTQNLTNTAAWSSSAAGVATISATGLAKGVGVGSSTINATVSGISGSTTLSVGAATLTSIAVTPANPTIPAGSPLQFDALGTYTDGSTEDLTLAVTWTSSSTTVATITSGGLALAVAAGNSTIGAKLGSLNSSTNLTVTAADSTAIAAPEWLEFVGDGSEGAYSCSNTCNLQGEHWFSSFEVESGATVVANAPNNPIVIRSTGTCTLQGTISNSANNGAGGNTPGSGDFGGGGGGGGAGAAAGSGGKVSIGDADIEIVDGGPGGNAPGGNGNNGAAATTSEYQTLLSSGNFWPVGGSGGGQGGSTGGNGGQGGGVVILACNSISFTGSVDVSGAPGGNAPGNNSGAGGGGGAGYVIFSAVTYSSNTGTVNITGGAGGTCGSNTGCGNGGSGGGGWNAVFTIPQ